MKNKKMMSLVLAGMLVASVLTACGSNISDNDNTHNGAVTSDVVGAVEGALKLYNSDLTITVKENKVMGDALQKEVFDKQVADKIDTDTCTDILNVLNKVFTTTSANGGPQHRKILVGDDFMGQGANAKWLNADRESDGTTRKASDKYYAYTVITSGEHYGINFNVYAANQIGKALEKLENNFRAGDYDVVLSTDYTMYLYRVDDKDSRDKDVPFLVAVIEASYKDTMN